MTKEQIIHLLIQARKKGSDKQFREWVQKQPSCITGKYDYTEHGPKCEAAHVRRASESGIGMKAEYSCVPMRASEHRLQHQAGESACLMNFLPQDKMNAEKSLDAKAWFDEQRVRYLQEWIAS